MQHIGSNGRKPGTGSDYSQSSFSMLDSGIQCWFTTLGYSSTISTSNCILFLLFCGEKNY